METKKKTVMLTALLLCTALFTCLFVSSADAFPTIGAKLISGFAEKDESLPPVKIISPVNGDRFILDRNEVWIWIQTNEVATCKYSMTNPSFDFSKEGVDFTSTNSLHHSFLLQDIYFGKVYTLYYRCSNYPSVVTHAFKIMPYPPGSRGEGGIVVGEGELCNDNCAPFGTKECRGNGFAICGNFNNDSCMEWSGILPCKTNEICHSGECLSISENTTRVGCAFDDECPRGEYCFRGLCRGIVISDPGISRKLKDGAPCIPIWECGSWSNCKHLYSINSVIKGTIAEESQIRICYDIMGCSPAVLERRECYQEVSISINKSIKDNKAYFDIYDKANNTLVAKVTKYLGEKDRLDIAF